LIPKHARFVGYLINVSPYISKQKCSSGRFKMNKLKLIASLLESDIADILTLSGAVGIIFIQTYGAWMLFTHF
jgi:hypothetical protein